MVGLSPLSDLQIDSLLKGVPQFGGVFMKDNLPKLKSAFYIVNLDKNSGPGTHWVLVFNLFSSRVIYFDPLGIPYPPQHIFDRLKETRKQIYSTDLPVQRVMSDACGYYCIVVALLLKQYGPVVPPETVILSFFPKPFNETKQQSKIKSFLRQQHMQK